MAQIARQSAIFGNRAARRAGLARLLGGVSAGAAALALSFAPSAVRAGTGPGGGAVNGTPTAQFGVASITRTPTLDTVTVNAKDALIDWASNDPNVYLPVSRNLQFTGVNGTPYNVLNRVDAAGPLQVNGTVASDAAGKVWFYNPGGWIVGSSGVFNVGSLVLSSNPIAVTAGLPDGQRLVDANGAIHFTQGLAGSSVTVNPGATVTAGNYVAIVSPRVVQGGTVTAGGSVAYVGAEAATLNVNNGLFDITVDTGTTDTNGVVHTGTTTGSAGSAARSIYMVAVPKNQLLTMLVSGNVGYAPAVTARGQVDGTIVLGAGYNVKGGAVTTTSLAAAGASARLSALTTTNDTRLAASDTITVDATASSVVFGKNFLGSAFNAININAAGAGHVVSTGTDLVLSEFTITPSRTIALNATAGGAISVAGRTDLFNATGSGTGAVTINAATGGGLTFAGDLAVAASTVIGISAADAGSKLQVGGAVALRATNSLITQSIGTVGGAITLSAANAAKLTIAGSLDVRADASGGVTFDPANPSRLLPRSVGVAATAGTIAATNTNATFTVGTSARLEAVAYGGLGALSAGDAHGGSVSFTQTGTGAVSSFGTGARDFLDLRSQSLFANQLVTVQDTSATGANASSGDVKFSITGGNFTGKTINLASSATTYGALDTMPFTATAGNVSATFANGTYSATTLSATNQAYEFNEGAVKAGKVSLSLDNATLNLGDANTTGFLDLETFTHGTASASGGIEAMLSNASKLITSGQAYFSAEGSDASTGAGTAPDLTINLANSRLTASDVFVYSNGRGGALAASGTGGLASIALSAGSALTTTTGGLFVSSNGIARSFDPRPANGGVGTGGTSQLAITDSTVSLAGDLNLSATGQSGPRTSSIDISGLGQGGTATVSITGAASSLKAANISVSATGEPYPNEGPSYQFGGGTIGIGGTSRFTVANGATVSASSLSIAAAGFGSDGLSIAGGVPAKGGTGTGGTATLTIDSSGGTVTAPTVIVDSSGFGGAGADNFMSAQSSVGAGDGGTGRGGQSTVNLNAGSLTTNALVLTSGGNRPIVFNGVPTNYGVGGRVFNATVGMAGIGGAGFGGASSINVHGGAIADMTDTLTATQTPLMISVSALGQGGPGGGTFSGDGPPSTQGAGGAGTGGTAQLNFDAGSIDAKLIAVDASAVGGRGGSELSSSSIVANAGAGGSARGGSATIEISTDLGQTTSAGAQRSVTISANGTGASGTEGLAGSMGGNGTGGFAGLAINGGATTLTQLKVSAAGAGGVGGLSDNGFVAGMGGTGKGGIAEIRSNNGATASLSGLQVIADGFGGSGATGGLGASGGAGGAGQGGTARLIADGSANAALSDYTVSAKATGGNGGAGGSGNVSVAAAGRGGLGGAATGGTVLAEVDGGSTLKLVQSDTGVLLADAKGGIGGGGGNAGLFGNDQRGDGGKGGDAAGGSFQFNAFGGGTVDLGHAGYAIHTSGGDGGQLGNGRATAHPQPSIGGPGGMASAGAIQLNAQDTGSLITALSVVLAAYTDGGRGGSSSGTDASTNSGIAGAAGGVADGGTIALTAGNGGSIAVADDGAVSLVGLATGGRGGNGSAGFIGTGANGGLGGNGGTGTDTVVSVQTRTDGKITFGANVNSILTANGQGGSGGNGGNGASNSAVGGVGGNGGDVGLSGYGQGGQINLAAPGGAITTGDLTLSANGFTPYGPIDAGELGMLGSTPGAGGAGGPAGSKPNPNPTLPPILIPPGPVGNSGQSFLIAADPAGGKVAIAATDDGMGQYGTIALGNVAADVTSQLQYSLTNGFLDNAGSFLLTDTTNAAGTGVSLRSLSVNASGYSTTYPSVTVLSINHPITVVGSVNINADGAVFFTGQDGGGLVAGDTIRLNSNSSDIILETDNGGKFTASSINLTAAGNIQLSAFGCPAQTCVVAHADRDFTAQSYNNQFILAGPARVEGLNSVSVTAGSNILGKQGSGYVSNNDVTLFGGGDVQVRNVQAARLTVDAGAFNTEGGVTYNSGTLSVGESDGSGRITTTSGQTYRSGGTINVLGGNSLNAGGVITFTSANDIIIGGGTGITANVGSPGGSNAISFNAGGIAPQTPLSASDIASLLVGNGAKIDAGAGAVNLTGAAIDARGASFSGSSFTADVNHSLTLSSPQSNDGGQLTSSCLEADICLGQVNTTGSIGIGLASTAPLHFLGLGSLSGSDISVFTLSALTLGSGSQQAEINAFGPIRLTSQFSDVTLLGGAQLFGSSVDISAGGSLLGNGQLNATVDDIGISVGGNIVADSLAATRQLTASGQTGGALEPVFATPGSLTVNTLTLGANTTIRAGGDIAVGQANLSSHSLSLTANRLTSLQRTSGITDLTLGGDSVAFGAIDAAGLIAVTGNSGVTGTSANAGTTFSATSPMIQIGSITSGTDITLANGQMTLGSIAAGGNLTIKAAGAVLLTQGRAGKAILINANSLAAPQLVSGGNTTLNVTNAAMLGTVRAGGNILIDPTVVSFTALTSIGSTAITAGDVLGGTLDAGTSIAIDASGRIVLDRATSGTTLTVSGATINAPALASGGMMTLSSSGASTLGTITSGGGVQASASPFAYGSIAATGPVVITGSTVTGGAISSKNAAIAITSPGTVTTGALASGTDTTIAAGALTFTSLTAGGSATINAASVTGTSANAGTTFSATSPMIQIGSITSGTDITLANGQMTLGSIAAGGNLTIKAAGAVLLTQGRAGKAILINANSLAAPQLVSGGNTTLNVTNAAMLGTVRAGGNILIDPTVVSFTALTSIGSTAITAGDVLGGTLDAGTSIAIDASGRIVLDRATSGTTLTVSGATINAPALASGGMMTLSSSGASTLGTITSGGGVQASASPFAYGSIAATGPVVITGSTVTGGAISSKNAAIAITSPGTVTTGALASGTDTTIAAGALTFTSLTAGGSATINAASVTGTSASAGQDLSVTSGGPIAFQTITAGRNATLIASRGNVSVSTDFSVGGTASVAGGAITINAKGPLTLASAIARSGDIAVVAGGALGVADGEAIGNIALTSQTGSLGVGALAAGYKPTSSLGNIAGGLGTVQPGPGNIALTAATGITASGRVDSAAVLTASAGGAITVNGLVTANTIALTSSDLSIGTTGQIGQARATSVSLTNGGAGSMVLGDGFDSAGTYVINNAEFARIHSGGDLVIDSGTPASGATAGTAQLTIGMLVASAANGTVEGNVGSLGLLRLRSDGNVAVLGSATLANAADNTLAISTSGDVMVDAARGSLRLVEGSGHGGTLAITAQRVFAVTPQALTDILAATTTSQISTRLSASDGLANVATLLEAGSLQVNVARGFYVQNTALLTGFNDRRGLIADSLVIAGTTTTTPITIVINGLINGQSGLKAVPLATINGSFDTRSTINGCVIVAVTTCNQPVGFNNPIRDVIHQVINGGVSQGVEASSIRSIGDGFFNAPLMQLDQIAPAGFTPLIDEPVTGTGNDDLVGEWIKFDHETPSKKKKAKPRSRGSYGSSGG